MKTTIALLILFTSALLSHGDSVKPKGVMLNLDFNNIKEGLIPSKTLYPLAVPLGDLTTEPYQNREVLNIWEGQHLTIPHSSLLDPDGSEWITTIRVFPLHDGIILSQGNAEKGYVIYMIDGTIQVAIRTAYATVILKESSYRGITHCKKRWVTIELKIKPDMALLSLNRTRVAMVSLQAPLSGEHYKIRLGEHATLPAAFNKKINASPSGFSGGVSSLKIIRQQP